MLNIIIDINKYLHLFQKNKRKSMKENSWKEWKFVLESHEVKWMNENL